MPRAFLRIRTAQNETASRPQPISNVEERAGYFRTLAPRPVTFRIAAVGALPSRERLIAMATGHDGAQGGNFFASVVSSDELRVTPAAASTATAASARQRRLQDDDVLHRVERVHERHPLLLKRLRRARTREQSARAVVCVQGHGRGCSPAHESV